MFKKFFVIMLSAVLISVALVGCNNKKVQNEESADNKEFKYYTAEEVKKSIEENKDIMLLDIQPKDKYEEHHIKGAVATYAYPVKTEEEKSRFKDVLPEIKDSEKDIVIVCPGGKGGAERTYKYLLDEGIKEERVYILENGQGGWPYENLLDKESTKKSADSKEISKYVDDSYIVDADWLKQNLKNDNILILDAREEKQYNKGHILGAVSAPWPGFADMNGAPGDKNWGVLLDEEALSKKLAEIGVTKDKTIVAYTDVNGWGEDGRIVWMLRMAGLENSKMLSGGINYWKANDYEISKEVVKPTSSDFKLDKINKDLTISTDELNKKLDEVKILDSRNKDEYDGATKFNEARGGHLPGAILLPFNTLLNEDGTFKSSDEMEKIFKDAGLEKDDEIVTYCTAGIRSAHLALVLRMMGYNYAKNYDASYYAWAGDENLPVVSKSYSDNEKFEYYTAEEVKKIIEENKDIMLLDIQPKDKYEKHHIKGAVATYAYPVKTDEEKSRFKDVLPEIRNTEKDIIIVCPGGKAGAERTYNYLLDKGIKEERLYILEKGQGGWPYEDLLEK
jgi:thiosulfate/3-mercaptopyruvate sulfurtransferase